jgi:hypothetical protein
MARIVTGILERIDSDQEAVLVGAVLYRLSRRELLHGLTEGMSVTIRCENSGEQTWATAVTPARKPLSSMQPAGGVEAFGIPRE